MQIKQSKNKYLQFPQIDINISTNGGFIIEMDLWIESISNNNKIFIAKNNEETSEVSLAYKESDSQSYLEYKIKKDSWSIK